MYYVLYLEQFLAIRLEQLKKWRTSKMNIIRVTKTSRNRVDVIFTGYQYLFFHADFGLVAVAERGQNAKQYENHFIIMRSEQISEDMIKNTIEKNESTFNNRLNKFIFSGEHNKTQHTLPYIVNVKLEKR